MQSICTLLLVLSVSGISAQTQKDDATMLQLSSEGLPLPLPIPVPVPVPVFVPVFTASEPAQDEPQTAVQEAPLDNPTQNILLPSQRLDKLREWITKQGEILEEKRRSFEKQRLALDRDPTESELGKTLTEDMLNVDPEDATDMRAQEPGWSIFDNTNSADPGCSRENVEAMETFQRFSDEDGNRMVMRHAGGAACISGRGIQKISFIKKSKAHTDYVIKTETVKTRLDISLHPLLTTNFRMEKGYDFSHKNGLIMLPQNILTGRGADWDTVGVLPHRFGEWMTAALADERDPNHADSVSKKGNVFGQFGRLILKSSFKATLVDSSDIPTLVSSTFGVIPFKFNDETHHFGLKWPGAGLMSNFQFVNSWSNGDWFAQPMDSFEYVRNFVLNDETQGSAFVEYHDFPHVFVPQGDRTTGRVLLADAMAIDRFKFSEMDKTTQSFKGGFEFMEARIHFGHGLVCGGDCIHSDSATTGPIYATVNPLTKTSDTALLRFEMEGKVFGNAFNPYTGIPDNKFDESDVEELQYQERFKDPDARKMFKRQWAADLIKEGESSGLKGAVAMS